MKTILEEITCQGPGAGAETDHFRDKKKTGTAMLSVKETECVGVEIWVLGGRCQTRWSRLEFGSFLRNNGRTLKVVMQNRSQSGSLWKDPSLRLKCEEWERASLDPRMLVCLQQDQARTSAVEMERKGRLEKDLNQRSKSQHPVIVQGSSGRRHLKHSEWVSCLGSWMTFGTCSLLFLKGQIPPFRISVQNKT